MRDKLFLKFSDEIFFICQLSACCLRWRPTMSTIEYVCKTMIKDFQNNVAKPYIFLT